MHCHSCAPSHSNTIPDLNHYKPEIQNIRGNRPLNTYTIQIRVKRKTGRLRFGDIREIHGTLLTKFLNPTEIDFLHGRISSSVFMRNYFNPVWISDLKERTFKAAAGIMQRIS
jgi:hypothetical protein